MPSLPGALRNEIEKGRCVLYVGAGASMDAVDANYQSLLHWSMLLAELLNIIQNSADPDPPNVVAKIQMMLNQGDFMAVAELIDFRLGDTPFRRHMITRLATAKYSRVHEILSSKPFRAVMTTNYDRLAEIHWEQQGKNPFVVIPQKPDTIATATDALDTVMGSRLLSVRTELSVIQAHWSSFREPIATSCFAMSHFGNSCQLCFGGLQSYLSEPRSATQTFNLCRSGFIPSPRAKYAILDGKGPVFKKYMKNNYNINLITYDAPGGDHSATLSFRVHLAKQGRMRCRLRLAL